MFRAVTALAGACAQVVKAGAARSMLPGVIFHVQRVHHQSITAKAHQRDMQAYYASQDEALYKACADGNASDAENLLIRGANMHITTKEGRTAVEAIFSNPKSATALTEIIEKTLPDQLNTADVKGITPFHYAARSGNEDAVRLLCNRGADPHKQNPEGYTALHIAAQYGHR